jgi:spoIIIJ-associated protein
MARCKKQELKEMILNQEQTEYAVKLLVEMLDALGLKAEISTENNEQQDRTILYLKTNDPGRLIGRKGHTLETLEYLLGRSLSQKFEGAYFATLDVDGYQKKRGGGDSSSSSNSSSSNNANGHTRSEKRMNEGVDEEKFRKIAADAIKEVRRWGEPHVIGPFKADERKIIHTALSNEDGIVAESGEEDRGGMKRISVRPAE